MITVPRARDAAVQDWPGRPMGGAPPVAVAVARVRVILGPRLTRHRNDRKQITMSIGGAGQCVRGVAADPAECASPGLVRMGRYRSSVRA